MAKLMKEITESILDGADIRSSLLEGYVPDTEFPYKIYFDNVEGDHDKQIKAFEDLLDEYGATFSVDGQSESYGGDYYVGGGLQAIDVSIERLVYFIKEKEIYDKLLEKEKELDFYI